MALKGIRVIEMAGLAPAPFCGMILSDFGASVIRVDKVNGPPLDRLGRGKRSIAVNLKTREGINIVKKLCSSADVLIEPFRPGIMEKLGLGPGDLMADNPRLVYARLTGFGQNGPYSSMAGHDINYVAVSGLLSMFGRKEGAPLPPQNLVADFAGGGMTCALGVVLALFEREKSQKGQIIDASMVEGAAYVGSWLFKSRDLPVWTNKRGENWFDGGTHFYETYRTKDEKYMTVGALEPQFYAELKKRLSPFYSGKLPSQAPEDPAEAKKILTDIFQQKTQEEWCRIFDGADACVAPVLSLDEAPLHIHNKERGSFVENSAGHYEPQPAPLLSRTPGRVPDKITEPVIGQHTREILGEIRFSEQEIEQLLRGGIAEQAEKDEVPSAKL